jgi:DNA-binding PadR family transcriptional regulator
MVRSHNLWSKLSGNYEFIEGAQIANSFICLLTLSELAKPVSATEMSRYISLKTEGKIFKVSATLKDSLEHRLRAAGYVEGTDIASKTQSGRKPIRVTMYQITPRGKLLLHGWQAFLRAVSA